VSHLKQGSILSIIQSKFKKFQEGDLYLLLLIPLLFIVYHSISDLAVANKNQSIFNLDFEGRGNQSIFNLDFEGRGNQSIFNLDFEGRGNQSIFNLDFERQNVSISSMVSSHFRTINYNNESSSLAIPDPLFGNNSLRVDIKPSNDTTKWNTISTDFIPVNESAHYNFSLYLSAKDVNQLHSKIIYFDLNKTAIKSDNIFDGRDGTFEAPYNKIDSSPIGTKYIKLQILSKSNPNMSSSYIIDNVNLEEVIIPKGVETDFMNNSDNDREQNAMKAIKVA
jgi:hypothetical protein